MYGRICVFHRRLLKTTETASLCEVIGKRLARAAGTFMGVIFGFDDEGVVVTQRTRRSASLPSVTATSGCLLLSLSASPLLSWAASPPYEVIGKLPARAVRGNVHVDNFRFDDDGVVVTRWTRRSASLPIRHCNLWLLTSQPLSFPASQPGGSAALRSYRQVTGKVEAMR